MNEFKKELNKANELRVIGKNREALRIFEKCYESCPDEFSFNQKNDYAWTIYKTRIQHFESEDELFENAEFVTHLVAYDKSKMRKTVKAVHVRGDDNV